MHSIVSGPLPLHASFSVRSEPSFKYAPCFLALRAFAVRNNHPCENTLCLYSSKSPSDQYSMNNNAIRNNVKK